MSYGDSNNRDRRRLTTIERLEKAITTEKDKQKLDRIREELARVKSNLGKGSSVKTKPKV